MSPESPELSPLELHRLLANMLRKGRVEQVRTGAPSDPAACRVRTGELLTTWVPWFALAAGGEKQTRHWRSPSQGEPCLLLAPGGDLAQAVALPGLYSTDMPQAASDADVERHDFSATDYWEHRRSTGVLQLVLEGGLDIQVGESRLLLTPNSCAITSPRLTHNGVNIGFDHEHKGVVPGIGKTGEPV